eukprot:403363769
MPNQMEKAKLTKDTYIKTFSFLTKSEVFQLQQLCHTQQDFIADKFVHIQMEMLRKSEKETFDIYGDGEEQKQPVKKDQKDQAQLTWRPEHSFIYKFELKPEMLEILKSSKIFKSINLNHVDVLIMNFQNIKLLPDLFKLLIQKLYRKDISQDKSKKAKMELDLIDTSTSIKSVNPEMSGKLITNQKINVNFSFLGDGRWEDSFYDQHVIKGNINKLSAEEEKEITNSLNDLFDEHTRSLFHFTYNLQNKRVYSNVIVNLLRVIPFLLDECEANRNTYCLQNWNQISKKFKRMNIQDRTLNMCMNQNNSKYIYDNIEQLSLVNVKDFPFPLCYPNLRKLQIADFFTPKYISQQLTNHFKSKTQESAAAMTDVEQELIDTSTNNSSNNGGSYANVFFPCLQEVQLVYFFATPNPSGDISKELDKRTKDLVFLLDGLSNAKSIKIKLVFKAQKAFTKPEDVEEFVKQFDRDYKMVEVTYCKIQNNYFSHKANREAKQMIDVMAKENPMEEDQVLIYKKNIDESDVLVSLDTK